MVLADGCFDPLHVGHIRYLEAAARQSSPLIVRVAPDQVIRDKGRVPFQAQFERERVVVSLRMVDDVCNDETLAGSIRRWRPDYLVKGEDWRGRLPQDVLLACAEIGTAIIFAETQERTSTERLRA